VWPGAKKKARTRLDPQTLLDGPTELNLLVTVISPNALTSPISSAKAALFQLELVERLPSGEHYGYGFASSREVRDVYAFLGSAVLGDILVLQTDDGAQITVAARRARLAFATGYDTAAPLTNPPPELMPHLRNASGRGVICFREQTIRDGDRFRLEATVESVATVSAEGYRSTAGVCFVVRTDAAALLAEIIDTPAW
jgi:hypothetical protein